MPNPIRHPLCIVLLSLTSSFPCLANDANPNDPPNGLTIYQEHNSKGAPSFTDQPSPHAKPITLSPTNTTERIQASPTRSPKTTTAAVQHNIQLTAPANQTVFENSLAGIPVSVNVEPSFSEGMSVSIWVNGQLITQGAQTHFMLYRLPTGTQTIEARLELNGTEISRSQAIQIKSIRPGG